MCTIAGYTGNKRAAPILVEMLRREEGFWSGYYTGIATIDNGKIYCVKVLGDLETLIQTTEALDLPGTTGIIHGRTPSGGGAESAQPYVSGKTALVENGSSGVFDSNALFAAEAVRLYEKGHRYTSAVTVGKERCPRLPDGSRVSFCDIQVHLCDDRMQEGNDPLTALIHAEAELPMEDVGVMVNADYPGSLFAARYNQPMTVARTDGESFLATSPLAFPEDRDYISMELLPPNAGAEIWVGGMKVQDYPNPASSVQPITAGIWAKGYAAVRKALEEVTEPLTFPQIDAVCKTVFTGKGLKQSAPLAYAIVADMVKNGEAELKVVRVDGVKPPLTAPSFRIVWKRDFS